MSRPSIITFAAAVVIGAVCGPAFAQNVPAYVAAAVIDPSRPAADTAHDVDYRPADVLAFSSIKPGDKVFEYFPSAAGGYYLRLLSKLVGPSGHVYAPVAREMVDARPTAADAMKALAANPAYSNVTVLIQPARAPAAPEPLDAVVILGVYHDLHTPAPFGTGDLLPFNKQVFAALKPGGVYVVSDHVAPKGAGFTQSNTVHRVEPDAEKAEIMQAGFLFDGASSALAKPGDDYTIHSSATDDQFLFRFRKPK